VVIIDRLEASGFRPVQARDARAGWRHFWTRRPEVVVLDVDLPSGDGWKAGRDGVERVGALEPLRAVALRA